MAKNNDAEAIIAHELAHVARLDWASLLLARIATALLWFNPLVWMVARQAHQLREEAADDAVLRSDVNHLDYAALLVGAARPRSHGFLLAANGVAPSRGSLRQRITRVLRPGPVARPRPIWAGWASASWAPPRWRCRSQPFSATATPDARRLRVVAPPDSRAGHACAGSAPPRRRRARRRRRPNRLCRRQATGTRFASRRRNWPNASAKRPRIWLEREREETERMVERERDRVERERDQAERVRERMARAEEKVKDKVKVKAGGTRVPSTFPVFSSRPRRKAPSSERRA